MTPNLRPLSTPVAIRLGMGLFGIAIGVGAFPAAAKVSCELRLAGLTRIESAVDYNPFSPQQIDYTQFKVQHRRGPGCNFMVAISQGDYGDRRMANGASRLDYELYTTASLSQPVAGEGGPLSATFTGYIDNKSGDQTFTVYSVIGAGQYVAKGNYLDDVTFSVYGLESSIPTSLLDTQLVDVKTVVRDVAQANVIINGLSRSLTGTVGTLDLGELTGGASRTFELEITGNSAVDLTLSSENVGTLKGTGITTSIPYSVTVNGQTLSLTAPRTLPLDTGTAQRYSLTVSVNAVSQAVAGTYGDNLTLSIVAR